MSVFNLFVFLLIYILATWYRNRLSFLQKTYLKTIALLIILMPVIKVSAQENHQETLVRINGKNISVDEFVSFHKINDTEPLGDNKETLTRQLNQFIDIKLNVAEAERKAYERSKQFINTFEKYKKRLAETFFMNSDIFEKLSKEAYQRIKYEVRASQVLIKLSKYAPPEDTLIAYEKAMNIKRRLIDTEKFENVAREVSDDPQAVINGGDLWYVGAFKIPYEVENYLFKGAKNTISDPIRSELGYHIVKIVDRRKNPGIIKVSQIMVAVARNANKEQQQKAKRKIDSLYRIALKANNFSDLIINSDDKTIGLNNGELPWFGSGQMPHEFETAAFNLQRKGEISKPIRTEYGWHILKKIDQQKTADYSLIKDQIRNNIYKSDRYRICKQNIIKQIQKKYGFKENRELNILYTAVDSSIFEKKWQIPFLIDLNGDLFEIGNAKYTKHDFAKWLAENQKEILPASIENYVNKQYEIYKNNKIVEFAINTLYKDNKTFKIQLSESYDGMLLFKHMETEVWGKTINDTVKLKQYYEKNSSIYNNKYSAKLSVFKFENGTDVKKLKKYFEKYKKKNLSDNELTSKVGKSIKKKFYFVKNFMAEEGKDKFFDKIVSAFRKGNISTKQNLFIFEDNNTLVYLDSPIKIVKKPWNYYKSALLNDYQNYTYKQGLKNLRSNYNIQINELVLESLYRID